MREVRVLFNSQGLKMYIFDRSHLLACTKSKGVSKKESNGFSYTTLGVLEYLVRDVSEGEARGQLLPHFLVV